MLHRQTPTNMKNEPSRVTRSRTPARAASNHLGRWYDALDESWEAGARSRALSELNVRPGETVFDVGCGTGRSVQQMAQAVGERGLLWGLDISSGMVRLARARVHGRGPGTCAGVTVGDAACLPCADASFDAAFTLPHVKGIWLYGLEVRIVVGRMSE